MKPEMRRVGIIPIKGIPMITMLEVMVPPNKTPVWPGDVSHGSVDIKLVKAHPSGKHALYKQMPLKDEVLQPFDNPETIIERQNKKHREMDSLINKQTEQIHNLHAHIQRMERIIKGMQTKIDEYEGRH